MPRPPPSQATELPPHVRALARLLDAAIRVPGTNIRIGLDPLLGLIPAVGDILTGAASLYILWIAWQAGAPPSVLWRMLLNVALDVLIGAIPILGDLFDIGWKSNSRNVALLEQFIARPAGATRSSRLFVATVLLAVIAIFAGAIWLFIALVDAVS